MRILVVGAGALGGYFGGRLKEAGRDVTFLVRSRRAEHLAKTGLVVRSPKGDIAIAAPPTVLAENLSTPFDLILLSCKAYDLQGAMESFAPAVGANTAILPLLNGMKHMDLLAARFRARAVPTAAFSILMICIFSRSANRTAQNRRALWQLRRRFPAPNSTPSFP